MKATKEKIDYMIQAYVVDKKTTRQIAKELGISSTTVGHYLRKNGTVLSPQKYKFNEHYFKEINTPNKAYFLGLIYADGCVFPKKNSCSIKLTKEDDYLLEEFKKDIDSQKPLSYQKSKVITGTNYVGKAQSKIELNSKILISDLEKLGVVQNKSLILKFPSNILHMKDFLRGYFDGDGCIYNSQKRIMLNFVGSEYFCKGLCDFLKDELEINVTAKKDNRGSSWYTYVLKINDVLKFCFYIYGDGNCIKLNRKYEKYQSYLNQTSGESMVFKLSNTT
jgi:hypothetical protein